MIFLDLLRSVLYFFFLPRHLERSTLFPYTTLFRSPAVHPLAAISMRSVTFPFAVNLKALARRFLRICCRRSEEHTSELQSHSDLVCRLLLEKKKFFTVTHV